MADSWLTLAELADACRAGNGEAWDELLNRYERLVYTVAFRQGLSQDDAADVTQTTFEALLARLGRMDDDNQIPYWLMTVARRQAWRLRNDRRRQVPGDAVGFERPDGSDPLGDLVTRQWLHEGLLGLDEACRQVLIALYFNPEPLSYAELAVAIGRPVGSIGPIRARCLSRLRQILENRL